MSLDVNPSCVYIVFDRCQVRMYIHGCFLTPPCVNAGKTFIVNANVTLNNVFCSRTNPLQCFYRTMKMCPSTCVCLPVCLSVPYMLKISRDGEEKNKTPMMDSLNLCFSSAAFLAKRDCEMLRRHNHKIK